MLARNIHICRRTVTHPRFSELATIVRCVVLYGSPGETTLSACEAYADTFTFRRAVVSRTSECDCTSLSGYGCYCGPFRIAPCKKTKPSPTVTPIDDLDRTCAIHDCCLVGPVQFFDSCNHKSCNKRFLASLLLIDCSKSPDPGECERYRARALALTAGTVDYAIPLP